VHYDLPVGGRRLLQQVDGYDATIVSGVVTQRGGAATGARPAGWCGRAGRRAKVRRRGGLAATAGVYKKSRKQPHAKIECPARSTRAAPR